MTLHLRAMQFPHPGPEHRPGVDLRGRMGWNVGDHRRKFLQAPGTWVTDAAGGAGPLRFWGEWEPPSDWEQLPRPQDRRLPRFIHHAVAPGPASGWRQNTDPLVLDGFWYSNCRQHGSKDAPAPTKMTVLDVGSVILFGSKVAGEWVLDTVFVVGERDVLRPGDVQPLANQHTLLVDAALGPLYSNDAERRDFVLYRGATIDAPVHGRYSFVPAVPAERGAFARPALRLPTMNYHLTQETRTLAEGRDAVHEIWQAARQQVLDAGLVLATSLHGARTAAPQPRTDAAEIVTAGVSRGRC